MLLKADGTEIVGLLVGKTEGAVTYVKLKSGPAVYAVDAKQAADIRKAPTEIPG